VQGSFETPPIILKARPARGALALGGSALMDALVVAAVLIAGAKVDLALLFYFAFFAVGCAAGLWMLMAPAQLVLDRDGLCERVLWRTRRFGWGEIYDFQPAVIGLMATTVGFNFTDQRPRSPVRWLSSAISGVQESLNAGWEMDPRALASLLNSARSRWVGATAASDTAAAPAAGFAGARMDRRMFACLAGLIAPSALALSAIPLVGGSAWVVAALFGVRIYAARLHDIGRSGWWQLGIYGLLGALALSSLAGLIPAHLALMIAAALQVAATLALCLTPGEARANRFGPAPGQPSALALAEPFR
jgi:uncharacterized membrane protein YhaH (DUF805 family)